MKATDLAQILSSIDMWGLINNYYTHHVEFGTTAHQEFSVVFDDKAVKEGYYLWIWTDEDEDYKDLTELFQHLFGVDFTPFLFHQTDNLYHFILKIDDEE